MGTELFCLSAIVVVLVIADYNRPYAIHYRPQHPPPPTLEVHSHLTIDDLANLGFNVAQRTIEIELGSTVHTYCNILVECIHSLSLMLL